MSRRPGTIIDEIVVDMPDRDNPLARRRNAKVNDYVARLMDRLDIAHASLEANASPEPQAPGGTA
jgi:NitT/TauT family transport system ATP-binding protein